MSGPIVRTGTTPKFWENWDRIFGDTPAPAGGKPAAKLAGASKALRKAVGVADAKAGAKKAGAGKAIGGVKAKTVVNSVKAKAKAAKTKQSKKG